MVHTEKRLLLIRHCESTGQAPDAPLSPVGRAQAEALAGVLEAFAIDRIVSSPYLRARQTIEPFALFAGLPVAIDDRLAERRLSPTPIDGWRAVVERSFRDPDFCVPGGESGAEVLARGWAAIRAARATAGPLAAVVSHGQLLGLVLNSIDARFGFRGWESMTNPDVYLLESSATRGETYRRVWISPPPTRTDNGLGG